MTSTNKKKIALAEKYKQEKLRNQAMKLGVTIKSPETVFLSEDTKFGKNVIINPYVVIGKKTKIGNIKKLKLNLFALLLFTGLMEKILLEPAKYKVLFLLKKKEKMVLDMIQFLFL